jgi:hypothetical protein
MVIYVNGRDETQITKWVKRLKIHFDISTFHPIIANYDINNHHYIFTVVYLHKDGQKMLKQLTNVCTLLTS